MVKLNILSLIVSFIGGGAVGAVLNWIRANLADKRTRRIKYLEDQLNNLYGPLYFVISQSDKLLEIQKRYQKAYKEEFVDKHYSREQRTQEILIEEADQTIKIGNEYVNQVRENNNKIKEILDTKFSYIDAEDIELIMNYFYEHFTRLETEDKNKVPLSIYEHIGNVSFLRPELIEGIKKKFMNKKEELEKLSVK
jgi:hypothetical protein